MIEVDARGLSCPEPVILTMNAMKKGGSESIKVTVSNTVARDNICSLAMKAQAHGDGAARRRRFRDRDRLTHGAAEGEDGGGVVPYHH